MIDDMFPEPDQEPELDPDPFDNYDSLVAEPDEETLLYSGALPWLLATCGSLH